MSSILFICTANRFRSILAETIFLDELTKRDLQSEWIVGSAGTWTENGLSPMPETLTTAQELGLKLSSLKSRLINAEMINKYSLILVMESGQKEALNLEFPNSLGRVHLLSEVTCGMAYDIPDPFMSEEPAVGVAKDLYQLIRDGFEKICQLADELKSLNGEKYDVLNS
ncbi:MAG: hypothetical protein ABIJ65_15635 [Chloroflexota bacterium]